MSKRFEGKVAVVIGAGCVGPGWGNGRAIAVRLAAEGADVFGVDLDLDSMKETAEKAQAAGGVFFAHRADATRSGEVEAAVGACVERFGGIDILINNVGGGAPGGPVEMSEAVWNEQLDLNLKSTFLSCKYVIPVMIERNGGSIVSISSIASLRWTGSGSSAYSAAKAGLNQLARTIAVRHGSQGIRANTVVAGQLDVPVIAERIAKLQSGGDVEALKDRVRARIPLGILGDGRDIASAALFLASDEARFITGIDLVVDGGMSIRCD